MTEIEHLSDKAQAALAYVKQWHDDRESWKFKKNLQSFLLKHMWDTELVPDEYFEYLVPYLAKLDGGSVEFCKRQIDNAKDTERAQRVAAAIGQE